MTTPREQPAFILPAGMQRRPMNNREFTLFSRFVEQETGIHLPERKRTLLEVRLAPRMRALGVFGFGEYYERVVNEDPEERARMIDAICTTETHFFREPRHFRYLEDRLLPELRARASAGKAPRVLRVWSAACSTGEEPYTIAMVLLRHCPPEEGWHLDIQATDLCGRVLERARRGVWPLEKAAEIPPSYLRQFMLRGVDEHEGTMKASERLRSAIRFQPVNLSRDRYPVQGPFDLIFCRNVLIYFTPEGRAKVVNRLLDRLDTAGVLFLGHSESLNGITRRSRAIEPTVYGLADGPHLARRS